MGLVYPQEGRELYKKAARGLIPGGARKLLEIGPHDIPCITGKNVWYMDIRENTHPNSVQADAREIPYPWTTDSFDAIVALQVLEHLGPGFRSIVDEWFRLSPVVVVSLPFLWEASDSVHDGITEETVDEWFGSRVLEGRVVIGKHPRRRIVFRVRRKS